MPDEHGTPAATLNRLSIYLRCLRELQAEGEETVSSQGFAERFHLSSAQIRKDLAHFGDFGTRGVGYEIASLADRLHVLLGLDRKRRILIVGMGNLGSALARYVGFNDDSFEVVAAFDSDPAKIGRTLSGVEVYDTSDLREEAVRVRAEIAVLAVPAAAATVCYEKLVDCGVRAVLNFAPAPLPAIEGIHVRNVDLRIHLEELSFLLGRSNLEEAD